MIEDRRRARGLLGPMLLMLFVLSVGALGSPSPPHGVPMELHVVVEEAPYREAVVRAEGINGHDAPMAAPSGKSTTKTATEDTGGVEATTAAAAATTANAGEVLVDLEAEVERVLEAAMAAGDDEIRQRIAAARVSAVADEDAVLSSSSRSSNGDEGSELEDKGKGQGAAAVAVERMTVEATVSEMRIDDLERCRGGDAQCAEEPARVLIVTEEDVNVEVTTTTTTTTVAIDETEPHGNAVTGPEATPETESQEPRTSADMGADVAASARRTTKEAAMAGHPVTEVEIGVHGDVNTKSQQENGPSGPVRPPSSARVGSSSPRPPLQHREHHHQPRPHHQAKATRATLPPLPQSKALEAAARQLQELEEQFRAWLPELERSLARVLGVGHESVSRVVDSGRAVWGAVASASSLVINEGHVVYAHVHATCASTSSELWSVGYGLWTTHEEVRVVIRHVLGATLLVFLGAMVAGLYGFVAMLPGLLGALYASLDDLTRAQLKIATVLVTFVGVYHLRAYWTFWLWVGGLGGFYYWSGHAVVAPRRLDRQPSSGLAKLHQQ